jgi:hypothetical protein
MRERRDIVKLARQARNGVLVTLVGVKGSSYRRRGAQMLLAARIANDIASDSSRPRWDPTGAKTLFHASSNSKPVAIATSTTNIAQR